MSGRISHAAQRVSPYQSTTGGLQQMAANPHGHNAPSGSFNPALAAPPKENSTVCWSVCSARHHSTDDDDQFVKLTVFKRPLVIESETDCSELTTGSVFACNGFDFH